MNKLKGHDVPINKTAALVAAKGFQYKANTPVNAVTSKTPLPTKKFTGQKKLDLTGVIKGRFTVVGFSGDVKAKWVVRCLCGNYEHRTSKAINNPKNTTERCYECRRLIESKRNYHYQNTGVDLTYDQVCEINGI